MENMYQLAQKLGVDFFVQVRIEKCRWTTRKKRRSEKSVKMLIFCRLLCSRVIALWDGSSRQHFFLFITFCYGYFFQNIFREWFFRGFRGLRGLWCQIFVEKSFFYGKDYFLKGRKVWRSFWEYWEWRFTSFKVNNLGGDAKILRKSF